MKFPNIFKFDFTERGHHKKKKVHKEIKKLVIKVIVAIFLVMQKIKWALLMIQTILLNNFIVVATLFVLSKTIKIWHELKHKHHHIEKQVVVYDNHHQHYDQEHSDYEEGHGHAKHSDGGWGWWGRSLQTQTEANTVSEQDYDNDYYSTNRVIRSIGKGRKRRGTS